MPCTDENKLLLIDTTVDGDDGAKVTLWGMVMKKATEDEEAERKNSKP